MKTAMVYEHQTRVHSLCGKETCTLKKKLFSVYKIRFKSVPSAIRQYEIRHLSSYYAFM
jgi:hypothetical protein